MSKSGISTRSAAIRRRYKDTRKTTTERITGAKNFVAEISTLDFPSDLTTSSADGHLDSNDGNSYA
jgi:hypothetical protein